MLTPKFSYLAPDMVLPRVLVSLYQQSHSPSMQQLSPHFLFWDSIILSPYHSLSQGSILRRSM